MSDIDVDVDDIAGISFKSNKRANLTAHQRSVIDSFVDKMKGVYPKDATHDDIIEYNAIVYEADVSGCESNVKRIQQQELRILEMLVGHDSIAISETVDPIVVTRLQERGIIVQTVTEPVNFLMFQLGTATTTIISKIKDFN